MLEEIVHLSTTSLPPDSEEEGGRAKRQELLLALERASKGTVLGSLLVPLAVLVRDDEACTLQMANTLQRSFSILAQQAAQVC